MMGSFLKPFYFWLQRYFSKPSSLVILKLFCHADRLKFPPRQPYEFWLGSLHRTVRSGVNQSRGSVKRAAKARRAQPGPARPSSHGGGRSVSRAGPAAGCALPRQRPQSLTEAACQELFGVFCDLCGSC